MVVAGNGRSKFNRRGQTKFRCKKKIQRPIRTCLRRALVLRHGLLCAQPRQGEPGEHQRFIGAFRASFVQATNRTVGQHRQAGIRCRPFVQCFCHRPRLAFIRTDPHRQPMTLSGRSRIGKEQDAFSKRVGVVFQKTGLANRLDQNVVERQGLPRLSAIVFFY